MYKETKQQKRKEKAQSLNKDSENREEGKIEKNI